MTDSNVVLGTTRFPLARLVWRIRHDSLLRNSLLIMATNAFTAGLGYVYWVIAARTYLPAEVGLVSAVISAMTLTSLVCNIGFTPALFQMLPTRPSVREWSLTLNTALLVTSVTSLIGALVVILLFYTSPQFHSMLDSSVFVLAFLASVPLWTACNLMDAAFQAERASGNVLTRNAALAILKMVLLIGFIPLHIGGLGIFLSWLIGCTISLVIAGVLLRRMKREYQFSSNGAIRHARSMVGSLVGHHFTSIGGALPYYLLPIIVTTRLSAADNAYFYTTWMLGALFGMISVAVAQSLFAEGAHAETQLLENMKRSILLIVVLLAPLMTMYFLFGGVILSVFGKEYPAHSLSLLYVLTVATVPDAITSVYISALRVQKRLRKAAFLNSLMASIVLVFSWLLLPTMGISAVGWGWLVSQSVGTGIVAVDFLITRKTHASLWGKAAIESSAG